jgi:hypothetical protein
MTSQTLAATEYSYKVVGKVDTLSDAKAYGRMAARFGWGTDSILSDVVEQFQSAAIQAYERRNFQLYGAPF